MTRRHRNDTEGSWHHVMNRAVARRSLFETTEDIRFFLAGVAKSVRRGQLEVHVWSVLTTHYHMLVRSPQGELSSAMRRIQNAYARYFNRKRRRDGPLHRGRFTSRRVDSLTYQRVLVRYIDDNPVAAGICEDPCEYQWGSARRYATSRGPAWLSRNWVEDWVTDRSGSDSYDPDTYPRVLDQHSRQFITGVVAARQAAKYSRDNLDSLIEMATPATLRWLQRKAILADGAQDEPPYVTPNSVQQTIEALANRHGPWRVLKNRRSADAWHTLHAGLLRNLAAANFAAIGARLGVSGVQARRIVDRHQLLIAEDEHYGHMAAAAAQQILRIVYTF